MRLFGRVQLLVGLTLFHGYRRVITLTADSLSLVLLRKTIPTPFSWWSRLPIWTPQLNLLCARVTRHIRRRMKPLRLHLF